jgi:hypothetical protein
MKLHLIRWTAAVCVALALARGQAQHFDEPSVMNVPYTQQVQDPYFGDYDGTYAPSEAKAEEGGPMPVKAEAKVVPQGDRNYRVVLRAQPHDSTEWPLQIELPGRLEGERIHVFGSMGGHEWEGDIAKKTLRINKRGYGGIFEMLQVKKKSPSEGLKPPADAILLVAYQPGVKPSLDQWNDAGWLATEEGIIHKNPGKGPRPDLPRRDLSTRREFKNVRLHLEFRIPYEPDLREQARGNSGVIFADRYEVQVLDSYGLVPGTGDCASIYGVAPPRVNAAFPPLSWQTYDITFYAPRMEGNKMTHGPRLTVVWNGVKVHENQTALTPTGDAGRPNAGSGPIRIQDHGSLIYYRNIWVEELPDANE